MNRREALRNTAFLLGGLISASTLSILTESCNRTEKKNSGNLFNEKQQQTVDEIADIIIPATDSPGAKAAGVGTFITMMIQDCYPEAIQKSFIKGLDDVDEKAKSKYNKSFLKASAEERTDIIRDIAQETIRKKEKGSSNNSTLEKVEGPNFFQLIRELTLLGYFTSEEGATQALAYVDVPGRYDGCVSMKAGQKAWAT